jgi:hypothetical protein
MIFFKAFLRFLRKYGMYVVRGGTSHLEKKFAEVRFGFGTGTINPELDPTWP